MEATRIFRPLQILAAATLAVGLVTAAAAQDKLSGDAVQLIDGSSVDEIIASLDRNGFSVELTKDSEGFPLLKSTDKTEPFSVYFYSCDEEGMDCGFIQFSTGWNMDNGITLARIEEWNATKAFGKANRDEEKDPWLDMVVNLKGGVTVENFDDTVDWWRVVMRQFEEHIGWNAN